MLIVCMFVQKGVSLSVGMSVYESVILCICKGGC